MKKIVKIATIYAACILLVVFFSGCVLTEKESAETKNTNQTIVTEESFDDEEDVLEVAAKDAYGEDLADVARYSDSIRTYYAKDLGEVDITYQTSASEQEIRDYYTSLLEGKGWVQTGVATDYIDFEKGDENNPEILTVYLTPYEKQGLLEYELVYSPPLTEEEMAEMEAEE